MPTNMPRCGTLFGTKRLFKAKRADKHAAVRVDPRVKTAIYGIKHFQWQMYCKMCGTAGHPAVQITLDSRF